MLYEFKSLLKETTRSAIGLYKIMIPISIVVKLLQYLGLITVLGDVLAPFMQVIGLPGTCGREGFGEGNLSWESGMARCRLTAA